MMDKMTRARSAVTFGMLSSHLLTAREIVAMRRLYPLLGIVALAACPTYERYGYVSSDHGLVEADQFAKLGPEQAISIAIGREFGHAQSGLDPIAYQKQADSAVAYGRRFPEVKSIETDVMGHRLVVHFASGWAAQVTPISDGKRGNETEGLGEPSGVGNEAIGVGH